MGPFRGARLKGNGGRPACLYWAPPVGQMVLGRSANWRGRIGNLLDWYIFRQLMFALVVVTIGLTLLIWLVQSLRFVDLVVNHGLSLWVFLKLTGLLIPSFISVILPLTTFVVVQFTYQRLAGDREL